MRIRSLFYALLLPALVAVLLAPPAAAEKLRLRSGKSHDVDALEILDRSVRVTMLRNGGIVKAELPFKNLDAIAFLKSPYAKLLTPLQRKRFELLAYVQHLLTEREKARKAKAEQDAPADAPDAPKPAPAPPPPARPDPDPEPPPPEPDDGGVTPGGRTGADERFRERRPWSRPPPKVPGTERPGRGGGASGGSGGGSAGGSSGGSNRGGGKSGGGGGSSGGGGASGGGGGSSGGGLGGK